MYKFTDEEKQSLQLIHLFSDIPVEQVKKVFYGMMSLFVLNYFDEASTTLPFVGEVHIDYKGDEITALGKKAMIDISLKLNSYIVKNIGQIIDDETTDIEKKLFADIKRELKKKTEVNNV